MTSQILSISFKNKKELKKLMILINTRQLMQLVPDHIDFLFLLKPCSTLHCKNEQSKRETS
jgi:hypothetical protein